MIRDSREYGISEVLGYVLIIGISISIIGVIYIVGQPGIADALDTGNENADVQKLHTYLSDISSVGFADNDQMRVLDTPETASIEEDVTITVYATDFESDVTDDDIVFEERINALRYDTQNGFYSVETDGIFYIEDGHGSVESIPSIDYRNETLGLPLLRQSGSDLNRAVSGQRSSELNEYVDGERFIVEIESKAYRGWGTYFEDNLDTTIVEYDDENNTVRAEFGRDDTSNTVLGGLTSEGDINIQGGTVTGDAVTSGEIDGEVDGNTEEQFPMRYTTLDSYIATQIETAQEEDWSDITMTVTAGEYYTDEIYLTDETLTIDLSDGDVTIVVDGSVTVENDGRIQIINTASGNEAEFLVNGSTYRVSQGSPEVVTDGSLEAHTVLGNSSMSVEISQSAVFEGLIYAPRGDNSGETSPGGQGSNCDNIQADTCIGANADVTGGIVAGSTYVGQSSTFEMDEAVLDYEPPVEQRDELLYIHTSVYEVELE